MHCFDLNSLVNCHAFQLFHYLPLYLQDGIAVISLGGPAVMHFTQPQLEPSMDVQVRELCRLNMLTLQER